MGSPAYLRLAIAPESGIELLCARLYGHAYDRHFHDAYAVGITEAGAQAFRARGARHVSTAGHVILLPPGEPHDGEAGDDRGFRYRMLYLPEALLLEGLRISAERPVDPPGSPSIVLRDRELAAAVTAAADSVVDRFGTAMARQHAVDALLLELGRVTGTPRAHGPTVARERRAVMGARDRLQEGYGDNLTIEELSAEAGMSRFRLTRAFVAAFGIPPHAYLMSVRLNAARHRLQRGEPAGSVALACGFADQAHLTHEFRRRFGPTPGAYRGVFRQAAGRAPPSTGRRPGRERASPVPGMNPDQKTHE